MSPRQAPLCRVTGCIEYAGTNTGYCRPHDAPERRPTGLDDPPVIVFGPNSKHKTVEEARVDAPMGSGVLLIPEELAAQLHHYKVGDFVPVHRGSPAESCLPLRPELRASFGVPLTELDPEVYKLLAGPDMLTDLVAQQIHKAQQELADEVEKLLAIGRMMEPKVGVVIVEPRKYPIQWQPGTDDGDRLRMTAVEYKIGLSGKVPVGEVHWRYEDDGDVPA